MNKVIDAEIVETELLEPKDLIKVTQTPTVEFEQLKQFSIQVKDRLDRLEIEKIKATEDNLKVLSSTRTQLNKEFKELEDSRKLTEQTILKPYKEFEKSYNDLVKDYYVDSIAKLKTKIDKVTDDLVKAKTKEHEDYFNELIKEKNLTFLKFKDLNIKINRSRADSAIKGEIDDFIKQVENDLAVIETYNNRDRVLVRYMDTLDLSNAIVTVDREIKAEEELKARQELELQKKKEYLAEVERKQKELESIDLTFKPKEKVEETVEVVEEKLLTLQFTVTGTKEQLIAVREFMRERGITYK